MKGFSPEGSKESYAIGLSPSQITLSALERAMERGSILEGPALLCDNEMNLHVALGRFMGIIPKEEALYQPGASPVKEIAILTRVGKMVAFCVKSITHEGGQLKILLSRRDAQKECFKKYISTLRPGDVVPAKITHMESFGVFLDIGCGTTALLPVDAISVSRISHPRLRFSVGDEFSVVIRSIDEEGRIYASRKELLGTWNENASLFTAGQTVAGTIRSIEPYGIFVELTPNLTGLAEYKEGVKENETASVYIKSILPERMKVKLIIIDSHRSLSEMPKIRFLPDETPRHLDKWCYSPDECPKRVESIF
ncbi:MAG: 30S ribosomal protein S1 [Ruminococcaceae bacterium]|nr:30S ribosomal protein S1 [Oscillospiraceae bacterium]